jgi:repressor LexA
MARESTLSKENAMKGLTSRQQEILNFVSRSIRENGYPPTIREIGQAFGIRSPNGVNDHLKALQRKGFLSRHNLKSRAMAPTRAAEVVLSELSGSMVEVPLVGRVAAGEPLLAVENVEDRVMVDRFFVGTGEGVFALRVRGDSMIDDGIHDGDFLFVRKQPRAERGSIVVALIEGEATVKRYFPEGDRIRFQPANGAMRPIYVASSDFRETHILGVVIGVFRKV